MVFATITFSTKWISKNYPGHKIIIYQTKPKGQEVKPLQARLHGRAWRGSNPQPPDPQSGVLSIELQAQSKCILALLRLKGKSNSIRSLLFDVQLCEDFPAENVFASLLPIYLKRWSGASHGKVRTWQLVF